MTMAKRRILLLEDDRTLRDVITEALREDGYVVEAVGDGQAALKVARRWPPDLIIVDLMLPFMSGEEFTTAVRRIDGLAVVPIIVVSASRGAVEVGARLGATASLRKPFDLYELSESIHQALR